LLRPRNAQRHFAQCLRLRSFTGGLGLHYGGERLGLTVVPVSGGSTKRQIQLLKDFGATVVSATPSYMLHLYEAAEEQGINLRELPLRIGIFGAEPWTEEMRFDIERKMGIDALNIYGLSEIMGPGVSQECIEAKQGMHIFEDHFLPEIIDPATGEPLPHGEEGELVLTTLTKEGVPLLRYRTRDICSLDDTPCACGRTHLRMTRITGRSDDMLIIRGVNVYPSQIEALLLETDGLTPTIFWLFAATATWTPLKCRLKFPKTCLPMKSKGCNAAKSPSKRALKTISVFRPRCVWLNRKPSSAPRGKPPAFLICVTKNSD
jgi:phenylacetate-CoA ligase (EC 6.2.1.30)